MVFARLPSAVRAWASCPLSVSQPCEQPPGTVGAPVSGTVNVMPAVNDRLGVVDTGQTVSVQAAVVVSCARVGGLIVMFCGGFAPLVPLYVTGMPRSVRVWQRVASTSTDVVPKRELSAA